MIDPDFLWHAAIGGIAAAQAEADIAEDGVEPLEASDAVQ